MYLVNNFKKFISLLSVILAFHVTESSTNFVKAIGRSDRYLGFWHTTNNFTVGFAYENDNPKQYVGYVLKLDSNGDPLWANYLKNESSLFHGVVDTSDNGVIATAKVNDSYIVKMDQYGNMLWAKMLLYNVQSIYTIIETSDQNLVIAPHPGYFMIVKLNADGNFIWAKAMGNMSDDNALGDVYSFLETSDKQLVVGGYFWNGTAGNIMISKLNYSNGDLIWAKLFGFNEAVQAIIEASDENIVMIGDTHVAKLNSTTGDIIWFKKINGIVTRALAETNDENLLIGGSMSNPSYSVITTLSSNGDFISATILGDGKNSYNCALITVIDDDQISIVGRIAIDRTKVRILFAKLDINGSNDCDTQSISLDVINVIDLHIKTINTITDIECTLNDAVLEMYSAQNITTETIC